jgi:hypothetical protein
MASRNYRELELFTSQARIDWRTFTRRVASVFWYTTYAEMVADSGYPSQVLYPKLDELWSDVGPPVHASAKAAAREFTAKCLTYWSNSHLDLIESAGFAAGHLVAKHAMDADNGPMLAISIGGPARTDGTIDVFGVPVPHWEPADRVLVEKAAREAYTVRANKYRRKHPKYDFHGIAISQTGLYGRDCIEEADRPYILDIYTFYIYDKSVHIRVTEMTPSYELTPVYTFIDFNYKELEKTNTERGIEDIREKLSDKYTLGVEDRVEYVHVSTIDQMVAAKPKLHVHYGDIYYGIPPNETFEDEDKDALERVRDYYQGNPPF